MSSEAPALPGCWAPLLVGYPSGALNAVKGDFSPMQVRSSAHGLPGTWDAAPVAPFTAVSQLTALTVAPDGMLLAGLRVFARTTACPNCANIIVAASCDEGATWAMPGLRIDDDTPPRLSQSSLPSLAVSGSGRIHATWSETPGDVSPLPGDAPVELRHAAIDPGYPVELTQVAAPTRCHAPSIRASVVDPLPCTNATVQWFLDGVAVPGATGLTFDLPPDLPPGVHVLRHEFTCTVQPACGSSSVSRRIVVPDVSTVIVDYELSGTLLVSRNGSSQLALTWTDSRPETQGYNVYEGTLASLWSDRRHDHAAAACSIPREPPDASSSATTIPLPLQDAYVLLVPAGCLGEGTAGPWHLGTRPLTGAGAPCGPMP
jgi:hypothetical protein